MSLCLVQTMHENPSGFLDRSRPWWSSADLTLESPSGRKMNNNFRCQRTPAFSIVTIDITFSKMRCFITDKPLWCFQPFGYCWKNDIVWTGLIVKNPQSCLLRWTPDWDTCLKDPELSVTLSLRPLPRDLELFFWNTLLCTFHQNYGVTFSYRK